MHPTSRYQPLLRENVFIPMRDGVELACDIYFPSQGGRPAPSRFPVILERTPYGKGVESRSERSLTHMERAKSRAEVAALFVARGFIVIYQDCRGRYNSGGVFQKYLDDAADGYDTCAWIVRQSWSDGQIGTKGLSYAAHTQAALASLGAPGIAAMFLDSGGFSNAFQGGIRQGGAFELKQATWAYGQALNSPQVVVDPDLKAALVEVDLHEWFRRMPCGPGYSPLAKVPAYEDYLFDQWRRGNFDDFWRQPGIYAQGYYPQFPDCPQVHMSSWYDPYSQTAIDNYLGLSRIKKGPIRLILGPWTHGNRSLTYAGDVDFSPAAILDGNLAADYWDLRLRWFDHWLRGVPNGVDREPAVRYFRMGGGSGRKDPAGRLSHGGSWQTAADWPPPGVAATCFYLHANGTLTSETPNMDDPPREYLYDPANPVPSIGGTITSGEPLMVGGGFDQVESPQVFGAQPPYRPLAERQDVLVFQTEPLAHPLEVTGPVVAHLWIASDCPDTDFTVKLVDVYPPNRDYPQGYALNLTDGILRVRYRDSWSQPQMMEPGQVYPIKIEAFPTSNLFQAGHRIRVDISSSNFPHFDLNFNTGEPEGRATYMRQAHNRVYMDAQRASQVVLPLRADPE
ncbi:MAG: CocE/NonD family hydrolase [Anaerolineales bacterium]|nr:CocE/NonD family hydrolase [Anaerolineales bacterium]